MTVLEGLGAHVASARLAPANDLLFLHVLDTLAAWAAGSHTREGAALVSLLGGSADTGSAIALHCALARLSEVDDIHLASMTTPGAIVVPAALIIASGLPPASWDREGGIHGPFGSGFPPPLTPPNRGHGNPTVLADAIVAGYEAMTRLGLAIDGPTALYRGIWPTYFAAPVGVAAAGARLLGLDARRTAHALALALITAAPGVGQHNAPTTTRWLAAGNAARNGWLAAQAAHAGFTSDLGLLDGPFLKIVFQITPDLAAFTQGLGAGTMLERVSFKPWCAARQTMAAVQAVKEIAAAGPDVSQVTAIAAHVLPPHLKMIDHGVSVGDRASHLTSLPYQIALALVDPAAMDDIGQSPPAIAPAVRELMTKVRVAGDDGLLAAGYPAAWAARVIVEANGVRHERQVSAVPGDPSRAWGMREVMAKLTRHVPPHIEAEALSRAARAALDGTGGAGAVVEAMRPISGGLASSSDRRP